MKNRYENKDEIYKCLQEKRYGDLLHIYYINSNMSITEMSKRIKCSRRALKRYLSGERLVPMKIIRYILEEYEIEYKSSDNADQGEFNENGAFIWHKEVKLFNTLYLVRSKILGIERFEAACMLDIPEDILKGYENGTKKISLPDIQKILNKYEISLTELFPALISYDGDKSFLPLMPVYKIYITVNKVTNMFDLGKTDIYITSDGEIVNTWAAFPITRYDKYGRELLKYMPNELSIDEYYNSSDLFFIDKDRSLNDLDKKLPPTYIHMKNIGKKLYRNVGKYERTYDNAKFNKDYFVILSKKNDNRSIKFDLKDYVFSDSNWYSMLQDEDYFKSGKLEYIGHPIPENLCLTWKDGQYIRIIELYMDKYPYRYFSYGTCLIINECYEQWVKYCE